MSTINTGSASLSPWWMRSLLIIVIFGFTMLFIITGLAYRNAPPIPGKVVNSQGEVIFTADDVMDGQGIFLKYGLMDNGSIWGHGGYLGPDYSAAALHRIGEEVAEELAKEHYDKTLDELGSIERSGIQTEAATVLKTNTYDATKDILTLTNAEIVAYRQQIEFWADYFRDPKDNGGLKPNLITDHEELRQFTSFIYWSAWASVTNRPGKSFSYTNNFPYDPSVGNIPTSGALLWSAMSLIVILIGTGCVLFAAGRYENLLGWTELKTTVRPPYLPSQDSPSQRALIKFFVVVALLFLMQTLVGGVTAHYRAEPGDFYGFQLESIFPSNLMRTWHLQTAIFWIATSFVAAALFLARTLRMREPQGLATMINILFVAFAIVIGGSLLGEWLGIENQLGDWWFLLGNQGWEFLELGRIWQYLMVIGLFAWFGLLFWIARPKNVDNPDARPLARMFLVASLAIPVFYVPALFYDERSHFTVVDTWRFWIIHLWVEGFFEFFATTIVAFIFYRLNLTTRNTALRVIYLDAILFFLGGLIGTGHHWYFNGQTHFNMALSGLFSVLEVVPLTLLTLDAWKFIKTTRREDAFEPLFEFTSPTVHHIRTFHFLMAVGFWNFLGAGVFGFLVNLPIVSYYEVGTIMTPTHGHPAMMGVFGMLAIALMTFSIRHTVEDDFWDHHLENYFKVSFWGCNIGLAMMIGMSLFPGGVLQIWDVLENGYWHARSLDYTASGGARLLEWLRLPGDMVFIVFGAFPLVIASIKAWIHVQEIGKREKLGEIINMQ
ncbi:nitric-oxide reductase large subunit [Candidatus Nitrosacidococcus sp. I8]|uniref:nitric-oxide reductase large subunit n=1 Tax=Candidatus Nitrosacidococcus sp. I8 TaxID=2942908 RepID=UPI0022265AAD|nr:cbb3-type cytochrome c oxidase subunit I [Candidatus Nitrosacidococcus sp. I8]CAH9019561.1 hypothetical protein NURINAE_01622 [Candidatus Nitrosacidococcus sp. I8]